MQANDTSVLPLKTWLRSRLKQAQHDPIDNLAKRILEDGRLPTRGSRGLYLAHLRSKGYSSEDAQVFEQACEKCRPIFSRLVKLANPIETAFLWIHTCTLKMVQG